MTISGYRTVFFFAFLLLGNAVGNETTEEETVQATCVPQGLLLLDAPYPEPKRPIVNFPYCYKYQECSCCNVSHVMTIQKSMLAVKENPDLAHDCKRDLEEMACRVCDPEVGVGLKETVCLGKCQNWFNSCEEEYFSYDQVTGRLGPCRTDEKSPLLCSKLSDLVADGEEFCEANGLTVSSSTDEDCWEASRNFETELCKPLEPKPPFWWVEHVQWIIILIPVMFAFWLGPRLLNKL